MAEKPGNIVPLYLRRIDERVDRLAGDVGDLKTRMTAVEERLASVGMSIAGVNRRIDRLDGRVQRIEKRLDLADTPY